MDDRNDVKELLDALKYTSSERLKSAQRKLTTARNTITSDALSYPYASFFSREEQETLTAAAQILGGFKNKIEHAKEVRAREERRREAHLAHCRSERSKLLTKCLSKPVSMDEHVETVVFHLALQDHKDLIARGSHFGHGFGYIEEDLNRGIDKQYSHLSVKHVALECWRESLEWLGGNLWPYDSEPDSTRIEKVMEAYLAEWRDYTLKRYEAFFSRYQEALVAEFAGDEAKARAEQAVNRRASIKVVK